jgi:cation:H+ antiporter
MIPVLIVILGFVLLIMGADFLVNGASSLAKKFNVPELVIGLTIVAFGTSTPELVVNIIASAKKYDEVVFGNVIGSNNFNLLMILGISGIIYPITVQTKTVWKEIPYAGIAGIILLIMVNSFFIWVNKPLMFRQYHAIILILFFILYLVYISFNLKSDNKYEISGTKIYNTFWTIALIIIGFASIIIGGRLVVSNAIIIARKLMVSDKLISLTIVSIGTSLPELAASAVAAYRKKSDLAIGNIIGSNIFNIFLILGISGIINPLYYNSSFNVDILIYIFSSAFLFIAMFTGERKKLDRWEAGVLVVFFVIYIVFLILRK